MFTSMAGLERGADILKRKLPLVVSKMRKRFKTASVLQDTAKLTERLAAVDEKYNVLLTSLSTTDVLYVKTTTISPEELGERKTTATVGAEDWDAMRKRVIDSLTWEEVSETARQMVTTKHHDRIMCDFRGALLFAEALTGETRGGNDDDDDDTYVGKWSFLFEPYMRELELQKSWLIKLRRALHQKEREKALASLTLKTGIAVVVLVSQWFRDFLAVFSSGLQYGLEAFPKSVTLEDIVYTKTRAVPLHSDVNKPTQGVQDFYVYPFDLGYHLVRFASLFGTVTFSPIPEVAATMSRTVYTDVEIFVHYAMRTFQNGMHYVDFAKNHDAFFKGPKSSTLSKAVKQAARQVEASFNSRRMFFRAASANGYVELMGWEEKIITDDDQTTAQPVSEQRSKRVMPVPTNVLNGIAIDVLDDVDKYLRKLDLGAFKNSGIQDVPDTRVESPIGRYLNFDVDSVNEFRRMAKKAPSAERDFFKASNSETLAQMKPVHRIYMCLVTVAAAMFATDKDDDVVAESEAGRVVRQTRQPNASFILDRCVKLDTETGTVLFSSVTEALPGLLFYIMLGVGSTVVDFKEPVQTNVRITPLKKMQTPDFFRNRPDRVAFFNVFGHYASQLSTISGSNIMNVNMRDDIPVENMIRWTTRQDLDSIRASAAKTLAEAQAAFTTFLAGVLIPPTEFLNDKDMRNQFVRRDERHKDFNNITQTHTNYQRDFRAFYALPLSYVGAGIVTDTSNKKSGGTSSLPGESNSVLFSLMKPATNISDVSGVSYR